MSVIFVAFHGLPLPPFSVYLKFSTSSYIELAFYLGLGLAVLLVWDHVVDHMHSGELMLIAGELFLLSFSSFASNFTQVKSYFDTFSTRGKIRSNLGSILVGSHNNIQIPLLFFCLFDHLPFNFPIYLFQFQLFLSHILLQIIRRF